MRPGAPPPLLLPLLGTGRRRWAPSGPWLGPAIRTQLRGPYEATGVGLASPLPQPLIMIRCVLVSLSFHNCYFIALFVLNALPPRGAQGPRAAWVFPSTRR
mmetsp:Transcript_80058/g.133688  ORF Transcript_80058/g.133688 Transcript_80058/m.133688 type:complete len:101 (-) Transcript_80058:352-654(-)